MKKTPKWLVDMATRLGEEDAKSINKKANLISKKENTGKNLMAKQKIARQGMAVSIKGLKSIIKELEKEKKDLEKQIGIRLKESKKWLIGIINKTPECSDTWEIERLKR